MTPRPSSLPPVQAPLRFIQDEGDVNIPALLAEHRRRLAAYPSRHHDSIAINLTYEVIDEAVKWSFQTKTGLSVVSAREARELSTDGVLS